MHEANEMLGSAAILFEPLLDDKQAGEMLGLHPKTLQRLARQGEVPALVGTGASGPVL